MVALPCLALPRLAQSRVSSGSVRNTGRLGRGISRVIGMEYVFASIVETQRYVRRFTYLPAIFNSDWILRRSDKSEYRHLNMHAPAFPEFLCGRSRMVTSHWFKATSIFQRKVDSSVDLFAADMKYWEQLPYFCMYTKIFRCWKDKDLLPRYRGTIIQSVKLIIRWNKRLKFES